MPRTSLARKDLESMPYHCRANFFPHAHLKIYHINIVLGNQSCELEESGILIVDFVLEPQNNSIVIA